jgi:uncharacterized delta-60 repeat protein
MRRLITGSRSPCRPALAACLAFATTTGPAFAGMADLDTTFAQGGRSIIPVSSSGGQAFTGALQPDGRLVLGGWAGYLPAGGSTVNRQLALFRAFDNGAYDPSFGPAGTGLTTYDFFGGNDAILDMASTPQGIYGVGYGFVGNNRYQLLVRYTAAGALDPTFGTNGVVELLTGNDDGLNALAIQADGKIVVGGSAQDANGFHDFFIARYNTNGTPDTTFGTNGQVRYSATNNFEKVEDLVIQPNGRIVAVGDILYNGASAAYVLGFTPTGARDLTFGNNGITLIARASSELFGRRLSLTSDGQIVVGSAAVEQPGFKAGIHIARLTFNGLVDTSFGNGGVFDTFGVIGSRTVRAIETTPGGSVLIAGGFPPAATGVSLSYVARYMVDGQPDLSFNGTGRKLGDMVATAPLAASAESITMLPDGRFYVGGYSGDQYIAPSYFNVVRFQGEAMNLRPDDNYLSPQYGVPRSTLISSEPWMIYTLAPRGTSVPVTITGGLYSINGGAATSAQGTIRNGDVIQLFHMSSAQYNTETTTTVAIGGLAPSNNRTNILGARMTTTLTSVTGSSSGGPGGGSPGGSVPKGPVP